LAGKQLDVVEPARELAERLRPGEIRPGRIVVLFRLVRDVLADAFEAAAAQPDDRRSSRPLAERQLEQLEVGAFDDDLELEQSRSKLRHGGA
jgi:hypothetical protein